MTKVIGMLVALAMFCAMPAVAFAGDSGGEGGDNVSSGNTQNGSIDQGSAGGDGGGDADGDGDGDEDGDNDGDGNGDGGDGGDAGNQACLIQQNAGEDANAECNQEQNFDGDTFVDEDNDGVDDDNEHSDDDGDHDDDSVESVELAQTGFDVGLLAVFGGIALASGLALLVVQRRRIS